MNLPTFLLAAVIFGAAIYVVFRQIKQRKSGGCNCSDCHCSSEKTKKV